MKDSSEEFSEVLRSVEQLVASGEYRKAIDLCEPIQLADSLPRRFWFLKAKAFEGLGDRRRAIEACRCEIASLRHVPPDLLGWIGTLLVDEGEYASGAICLAESCEIAASVDRLILLASAFARSGELGKALEALRKALELDPSNDEAWHNLGAYLSASSSEAEQAFGRALHLNPNRSDSYGGLAIVFIAQGRPVEAIDVAQKGLAKNALDGICHFAIGQGAELLGNMEMAEVAYSRAFRCDYDKPAAILGLGRVLELDGKITHALDWYLRGLRAWPDDARIRDTYLTFAENHKCSDPEVTAMCRRCASNSRHEGDLA